MNIVAFDLGASGGKVYLARVAEQTTQKTTIEKIHAFDNEAHAINNALYWDVFHIYKELNIGVRRAVELTGDDIACFGADSFSNDFCLLDDNGDMLCPVRCYRDERTTRSADKIYGIMDKKTLYMRSGNQVADFNTLMQLAAMRLSGQGHLIDNCARLLHLPDLLAYFMTGAAVSEYTVASVSQMLDFAKKDWHEEILNAFSLPRRMFMPIVQPGTVVGETTPTYNAQIGTKGFRVAAVCAHDTASAFVGAGVEEDEAIISCGTWALVGALTQKPVINDTTYRFNVANEGGCPGGHRLIRNVAGLFLIQEVRRAYARMGQELSYGKLEQMALDAPAFAFFIDVDDPAFYLPGGMLEKIKRYCLTRYGRAPEGPGEIARCIYESLAMKFRFVVDMLEGIVHKRITGITMVGGGVQSDCLCRFTANACQRPVVKGSPEATAIGNIALQMVALGIAPSHTEAVQRLNEGRASELCMPEEGAQWEREYVRFKEMFCM